MKQCRTIRSNRGIDVEFPHGFEFLFRPSRYKVAYGGRGSGKSWACARALVIKAIERKLRILCARELQLSITESVHRLLCDQISALGLEKYFEIQQQGIYGANGSEFIFSGIRNNPTKIKSTEGVNIAWCEEAEKISATSWEILIPTIREQGSEIWITFNPDEELDPTWQRFVVSAPPDSLVQEVNWHSNPWFPETLRREKNYLYRVDPESAEHIWGGKCRQNASSQIFRGKYAVESFTVPEGEQWDGPYFGADWGFAQDPTVLIKCWLAENGRKLYVEDEVYRIGLELDDTGPAFQRVGGIGGRVIRADSSRPETISHVRNHSGLILHGAEKWKGSVEDGITWLRSRAQIVIHPRCKHMAEEARLYSYRVDRLTSDVLPEPLDKNNHCWDALRYACEPMIQSSSSLGVWSRL
ncbi:MAG TPA: PBSX family phage terminase large subunit [Candidatus Sulfotelmatobacter sp.]|nr:PBSX family phage terminase large subunit [Candidatus Sulfotelmatobacter sp.]